jgi:hypothetical protein
MTELSLSQFIRANGVLLSQSNLIAKDGFRFEDGLLLKIKEKIKLNGVELKDYEKADTALGIITGGNLGFLLDESFIPTLNEKEKMKVHKRIRTEGLERYKFNPDGKYLIVFEKGMTDRERGSKSPEEYIIETYPNLYHYMLMIDRQIQDGEISLASHSSKTVTSIKDRVNGKGVYWWELAVENLKFKRGVCFLPLLTYELKSFYSNDYYGLNSVYYIHGEYAKHLCALLNSDIVNAYFKTFCSVSFGASKQYKVQGDILGRLIVPNGLIERSLDTYVDSIQDAKIKGLSSESFEEIINQEVQKLYGLTDDEVHYLLNQGVK